MSFSPVSFFSKYSTQGQGGRVHEDQQVAANNPVIVSWHESSSGFLLFFFIFFVIGKLFWRRLHL